MEDGNGFMRGCTHEKLTVCHLAFHQETKKNMDIHMLQHTQGVGKTQGSDPDIRLGALHQIQDAYWGKYIGSTVSGHVWKVKGLFKARGAPLKVTGDPKDRGWSRCIVVAIGDPAGVGSSRGPTVASARAHYNGLVWSQSSLSCLSI